MKRLEQDPEEVQQEQDAMRRHAAPMHTTPEFGRPFGLPARSESSEEELRQEIAYWDGEREIALNAMVFATKERIACSVELNGLNRELFSSPSAQSDKR